MIKNCNEKGIRAEVLGSNPHSKGLFFSRSENVFFATRFNTIKRINKIIQINFLMYSKIFIIYTSISRFFDWKSSIIVILYKYLSTSSVD